MKFKLQLIVSQDDTESKTIDVYNFAKDVNQIEQLGLTLLDSKKILKSIQENVVQEEIAQYLAEHTCCSDCGSKHRLKGHNKKVLNTLFGKITLNSPRYRSCRCKQDSSKLKGSGLDLWLVGFGLGETSHKSRPDPFFIFSQYSS